MLGWKGHYDVFDEEGHCQFGSVMQGDVGLNLYRHSERVVPYSNACPDFMVFIVVDDVDQVYNGVLENGWTPDSTPKNEIWGGRTFTMRDFNGFRLMFVQIVESVPVEEVRRRRRELRKRNKI